MRFRPANISLINRRHYLPRLLLILSSKRQVQNHPNDSKMLTGSHHITSQLATTQPELRNQTAANGAPFAAIGQLGLSKFSWDG